MNAPPADMIEYINRRIALVDGLSDALAARKARRPANHARSIKAAQTRRVNGMAHIRGELS